MKSALLIIIGVLLSNQVSAQQVDNYYANFYQDSIYYVIGDHVNIRDKPDTAGMVICKLSIGEKLRILEDSKVGFEKSGYTSNWYKVDFLFNNQKLEGYIWGGFIASQTVKSITDDQLIFMYGVSNIRKKEYYDEVFIQVRACNAGKELDKREIRAIGGLGTYHSAESVGGKGVSGVKDIFKINFSDGFCAGVFGDAYFFWDGKNLIHAMTLDEGFDAPYFSNNNLIFPTDPKGSKKGYIINYSESGFYDDNDKLKLEDWQRITYQWDGVKLVPIRTEKKK